MSDDCLACAKIIPEGAPTYPDVSGTPLCEACAPTYAELLKNYGDDNPFVDMDTLEPLSAVERRAIYDAHIAAGGRPHDSMAKV